MKKTIICITLIGLLYFATNKVYAQVDSLTRRKAVFVELLGNGVLFSANFDMRFVKGKDGSIGFRAGLGDFFLNAHSGNVDVIVNGITFPMEVNYLLGKSRHFLETGIGITPYYIKTKLTFSDYRFNGKGLNLMSFLNIGYRYQPLNKGLMFRVNWNPLITYDGLFFKWFGLSLGYVFK